MKVVRYKPNKKPFKLTDLQDPKRVVRSPTGQLTHVISNSLVLSQINIDVDDGCTIQHQFKFTLDGFNMSNQITTISHKMYFIFFFKPGDIMYCCPFDTDSNIQQITPIRFSLPMISKDCAIHQAKRYLLIWHKNYLYLIDIKNDEQTPKLTLSVTIDKCPQHSISSFFMATRTRVILVNGSILEKTSYTWVKIMRGKQTGMSTRIKFMNQENEINYVDMMYNWKLVNPTLCFTENCNYMICNEYEDILKVNFNIDDKQIFIQPVCRKNNHLKSIFVANNLNFICLSNNDCNIVHFMNTIKSDIVDLTFHSQALPTWQKKVYLELKNIDCNYMSNNLKKIYDFVVNHTYNQSIGIYKGDEFSQFTENIKQYVITNKLNCTSPLIIHENEPREWTELIEIKKIEGCEIETLNGQFGVFALQDLNSHIVLAQYWGWQRTPWELSQICETSHYKLNHAKYAFVGLFEPNIFEFHAPPKKKYKTNNNVHQTDEKEVESLISHHFPSEYQMDSDDDEKCDYICIDPASLGVNKIPEWAFWAHINECRKDISQPKLTKEDRKRENIHFEPGWIDSWPVLFVVTTKKIQKGDQLFGYHGVS